MSDAQTRFGSLGLNRRSTKSGAKPRPWLYLRYGYEDCEREVGSPHELTGVGTVFPLGGECGTGVVRTVGDHVSVPDDQGRLISTLLAEPVVDGATWELTDDDFGSPLVVQWHRETDPVTVAAGTFDDCWTVTAPHDNWTETYCRGVRLVYQDVFLSSAELPSFEVD